MARYDIIRFIRLERDRDNLVVKPFRKRKKGGVMPMNTMEVLTLLLVIFAALSYIDNHRK